MYHDRSQTEVRVRNVVMQGDWPERLTGEHLDNLAAVSNPVQTPAERRILGVIFDDRHIVDAAMGVHQRAAKLPADKQYEFLSDWVLPNHDHQKIRLALSFTQTHPSPLMNAGNSRLSPRSQTSRAQTQQTRIQTGGDLVSPAADLVNVAKALGRLDELRNRVEKFAAKDHQQQRSQLAMLTLIDIARDDSKSALHSLDQLSLLLTTENHLEFSELWPETLALWFGVRYPATREATDEMLHLILMRQVRSGIISGFEAWRHQFAALVGLRRYLELTSKNPDFAAFTTAPRLTDWRPVSRTTARTRGQGFPRTHWQHSPAQVDSLAGHDEDYLYFGIPLRGNFQVECDVSGFGWRDSCLLAAGRWVGPVNHASYRIGSFRKERPRVIIEPKLSKTNEWIRYRVVVRNRVLTTYFNGRKIHEEPLTAEYDPWIAIRSTFQSDGAVRNLRVTGNPEIPEQIRLTALDDLTGWVPYFDESIGGRTSNWRQRGEIPNGGGIVAVRRLGLLAGSNKQSLLRYHRPMLEDGSIEYEFYYRANESHGHPALDRLAFMLEPRGVRIHWITDGKFDRTDVDPANEFEEPKNRRGPDPLPLKPNAWNRLKLTLKGDTIELELNEQLVYQRSLESTNQRTFGLFRYSDRTEARVRNVVWRGNWPRKLPTVAKQELAGKGVEFLDKKLPELTDVFQHDFTKGGLSPDRFSVIRGNLFEHITEKSDGVHMQCPGTEGILNVTIAPMLSVKGDFDITASFDEFKTKVPEYGGSSSAILAVLNGDSANACYLYRRHVRHPGGDGMQQVVSSFVAREPDAVRPRSGIPEAVESTSGRMRLSRRGKKVYYLYADGDSPNYRIFGIETVNDDDIQLNGVRLITQTRGLGSTSIVWKSLTIRAEKLTGLATIDSEKLVAQFAKQRDELKARFSHDFAKDGFPAARFTSWGHSNAIKPTPSGLRVVAPGTDNWTSAAVAARSKFRGNLDITVNFDIIKLAQSPAPKYSCAFLQIRFGNKFDERVNILFMQRANSTPKISVQTERLDSNGRRVYSSVRIADAKSAVELRVVRRGETGYFLCKETESAAYRVLCEINVGNHDIPESGVRFDVHTGGAGLSSEVLWKKLEVRSD